jgi:hypothetical protein
MVTHSIRWHGPLCKTGKQVPLNRTELSPHPSDGKSTPVTGIGKSFIGVRILSSLKSKSISSILSCFPCEVTATAMAAAMVPTAITSLGTNNIVLAFDFVFLCSDLLPAKRKTCKLTSVGIRDSCTFWLFRYPSAFVVALVRFLDFSCVNNSCIHGLLTCLSEKLC